MKKILLIVAIALTITACEGGPANIAYKDVPYPVYVVPAPNIPPRPALAVDSLTPTQKQDAGTVLQADSATVVQMKGYVQELETILNKYAELAIVSQSNLNAANVLAGKPKTTSPTLSSMTTDEWKKLFAPKVPVTPTK